MDNRQESEIVESVLGVGGVFKAHALRPSDRRVRELTDWQENLITNGGMNKLAGGVGSGSFMAAVRVGSGSTAPAYTDTQLVSHVASAYADTGGTDIAAVATDANPFMAMQMTFTFPVGVAAGNLTELGLAGNQAVSSSYPLYTRALFKDGSGNPITIVVGADEQLVITYVLRVYVPKVASTAVLRNASTGVDYTISMLPMEVDFNYAVVSMAGSGMYSSSSAGASLNVYSGPSSGVLAPIDGTPAGTANNTVVQMAPIPYVADSFRRDVTYTYGLTYANFSDMGSFVLSPSSPSYYAPCRWQWTVSPKITKTNTQTLSFTHRYTLARV